MRCSIHRLPRDRMIDTAGASIRHGRRMCPSNVGATSRPSFSAWLGSRNTGTVDSVSTTSTAPIPASKGGKNRDTSTMRSHVSPTMASNSTTAMARSGWVAASLVTSRPPSECPARIALRMPRWSSMRASRSA